MYIFRRGGCPLREHLEKNPHGHSRENRSAFNQVRHPKTVTPEVFNRRERRLLAPEELGAANASCPRGA